MVRAHRIHALPGRRHLSRPGSDRARGPWRTAGHLRAKSVLKLAAGESAALGLGVGDRLAWGSLPVIRAPLRSLNEQFIRSVIPAEKLTERVSAEMAPSWHALKQMDAALSSTRVVIADDHPLMLNATSQVFADAGGFAVVGNATTGHQVEPLVSRTRPWPVSRERTTRSRSDKSWA